MAQSNASSRNDTIVGLFVFLAFVGLILFTIVLSGISFFGGHSSKLFIEFERVGGLRRHDSVIVRGMPVGQVKDLSLRENGVLVTVELNTPVTIREGYSVRTESTSLLGGMMLLIDTGNGSPIKNSRTSPLVGLSPENVLDNANELISDVRHSLNDGGILTNLEMIISDIHIITETIRSGQGTIGRLVSTDDSLYNDLANTISNLNSITTRLELGEGTLGRLLSADDTPYNQITNFIANLDTIGSRIEQGNGTIGKLLSDDDSTYNRLTNFVANLDTIGSRIEQGHGTIGRLLSPSDPMAQNLSDTLENLKILSDRLERGEGLLGQLMRDDGEVTLQVNGILKDGRDLLDDMRETSPVSTFSSIFFGAF